MSSYQKHCTSCGHRHHWKDDCYHEPKHAPKDEHHHHIEVTLTEPEQQCVTAVCQGPRGPSGVDGARGEKGAQGVRGERGEAGTDGLNGEQGPRGPAGVQGIQGPQGLVGPAGAQGNPGPQGIEGEKGETGNDGKSCSIDAVLSPAGDQLTVSWYSDGSFVDSETINAPVGLQGEQGIQGEKGDPGIQGVQGVQGPAGQNGSNGSAGSSGFISKTEPDESGCFTVTFRDESGAAVPCTFQECVTLLACGYTGNAICETPAVTGIIEESPTRKIVLFTYPSGVTGEIILEQTNSAATVFDVTAAAVSGQNVAFQIETDGKIRYNAKLNKTALDSAGECTAPLDAIFTVQGLADSGSQLPQIQKEIGGDVTSLGFEQADNTFNLQAGFGNSQWTDDTPPVLFGGDAANEVGSMFTGNIDTFNNSTQTINLQLSTCRYSPVEITTDVAGNFLSAVDVNGNAVSENQVVIL